MEKSQQIEQLFTMVIILIFRIFAVFYCIRKAKGLNRSSSGWGIFGFFAPILAMIWISYKSPIIEWDENAPLDSSNLKDENEAKREIIIEKTIEKKENISAPPKYKKSNQSYTDQKNLKAGSNKSNKKTQQDYYEQNQPILKKIDRSSDRF
jgi:hypothetical protein